MCQIILKNKKNHAPSIDNATLLKNFQNNEKKNYPYIKMNKVILNKQFRKFITHMKTQFKQLPPRVLKKVLKYF